MFAWLNTNKEAIETLASIVTILAIGFGGYWTWAVFIKTRQKDPSALIEHDITNYPLEKGKVLLRVVLTVKNIGRVMVNIDSTEILIQKVTPVEKAFITDIKNKFDSENREILWPFLEERTSSRLLKIEPGEADQLEFDFIIDDEIEIVRVYSYMENQENKKEEMGWSKTTLHPLTNQ